MTAFQRQNVSASNIWCFTAGMDTLCRPLPFGTDWTRIRIGMYCAVHGPIGANPGASNPFFFGLDSSLSDYPYAGGLGTVSTGQRTMGLRTNNPNEASSGGVYLSDTAANGNAIIDTHDGVTDFQQTLATPPRYSTVSSTYATAFLLEFAKGYSNITVSLLSLTGGAPTNVSVSFPIAMAAESINQSLTALGAGYSIQTVTVTGATARDSFGKLDRICIHADNCNTRRGLNPAMAIPTVSINRLY